mgnify:CR=1 FL=1
MKKNLFLLVFIACSMTMMGQTDKKESNKESWYFKLGGSYFTQATATEFPTVSGQQPNRDIYVGGKLERVLLVLLERVFVMVETLDTALQIV